MYIILDGEAALFGINNELICFLRNGSHYMNDDTENFDFRSPIHVVANSLVVVGLIP